MVDADTNSRGFKNLTRLHVLTLASDLTRHDVKILRTKDLEDRLFRASEFAGAGNVRATICYYLGYKFLISWVGGICIHVIKHDGRRSR